MSKYYLVGSYYDMYNGSYSNEIELKEIKGIKLSSLAKIDSLTSEYSSAELLNVIRKELGINSLNHLAIKYMKSNDDSPRYYKIIGNDKLFNECIKSLEKHRITVLGKTRETLLINRNNQLFRRELEKLLSIINSKNLDLFLEIYPQNNDFSFLVKRFINSSFDNGLESDRELEVILLEFSRYKTFRGWFVEQKKRENGFVRRRNVSNTINTETVKKRKNLSYEEEMKLFDEKFKDKNNMSYDTYQTYKYNLENDEFLDEEEFSDMNVYDEDMVEKELTERRLKKRR